MKNPSDCNSMDEVRSIIDDTDKAIVALLGKRWQCVDRMWELKRAEATKASVPWRNKDVIKRVRNHATECGLPEEMAEALWRQIIGWGIQYQDEKLND